MIEVLLDGKIQPAVPDSVVRSVRRNSGPRPRVKTPGFSGRNARLLADTGVSHSEFLFAFIPQHPLHSIPVRFLKGRLVYIGYRLSRLGLEIDQSHSWRSAPSQVVSFAGCRCKGQEGIRENNAMTIPQPKCFIRRQK